MKKILVLAKKIYSLDKPHEFFTAMIIHDSRIVEMTSKENIDLDNSKFDEIFDYANNFIIPGFNDSHIHVLGLGKTLENLNLVGCSKQEFLNRIKEKILSKPADEWILGRGWDQEDFEQASYPSRLDLDGFSSTNPILLHRICGHVCVVNSKALEIAHVTADTPDPEGGKIDRDPITGEPTGILRESAIDLVSECIPSANANQKLNWLRNAIQLLVSRGITSVQSNDEDAYSLYNDLKESNELHVRVYETPMIEELPMLIKIGAKSNLGDDHLRWGRIKIFADGSLGAETAALLENYENSSNNGIMISEDKIFNQITQAHNNDWQLEVHAIGDRSAQLVVDQFEKTGSYVNRSVLTHCQILNKSIISKMSHLGVIANIQPVFLNTDLHWAEKKIGKDRMKYSYAWNTLLSSGIHCAGGSDSPVEKPDPLLGIHAAVNRQDNEGNPSQGWYTNESLSVWDAVRLFTTDSAFAEYQEHQKGKLLANYLADFIVLDKDIFLIPKNELRTIQVISTFMNGNQTFKQT